MTGRQSVAALEAALIARCGERERAEQTLARRLWEQREAEAAVERAREASSDARAEAARVWCQNLAPTRLQLVRDGAQAVLASMEGAVEAASDTLRSARERVADARKAHTAAAAGEEAVARLIERRRREEKSAESRRREEEGE